MDGGKVLGLRIFPDEAGKMNRSVGEVGGDLLVVSQFTLYGDASRGRRPSFIEAAPPEVATRSTSASSSCCARAGGRWARGSSGR